MLKTPLCDITLFVKSSTSMAKNEETKSNTLLIKRKKEIFLSRNKKSKKRDSDDEYLPENEDDCSDSSPEDMKKKIYCKNLKKSSNCKIEKTSPNHTISHKDSGLSEYEKMVQRNREEKMAFLEALKINEVKEDFKEAVVCMKPKKVQKVIKRCVELRPRKVYPTRKSLRLSNVKIDLSEKALEDKAIAEAIKNEEDDKPLPRVISFEEALNGKQLYSHFLDDFSDLKDDFSDLKDDKKDSITFEDHFTNMSLQENNIAKVVNGRISAMAIHPTSEKIIICAGSKFGTLGFWNAMSDSAPYEFTPHRRGVTCVQFHPNRSHQVYSSSYDGVVRCGDLEKFTFQELYNDSYDTCSTYLDFISEYTFLVAQTDGNIAIVDARTENKTSEKKHSCHNYPVKTVSVHPLEKSYFFTACNKGYMSLWDLRKLQNQSLIEIENRHSRSVNSAFFSPTSGNSILTTSADDSICIFDSSKLSTDITLRTSMRHNNFTGRWLTIFRSTWLPNSDEAFVVGSMAHPRKIEIFDKNMKNIHNFVDENLTSITSVNVFHPFLPVLAGANSSGKVYVFATDDLNM